MKVGVRLSQKVLLEHAVFRSIKTHYTFKKWTGETGHSNLFSFRFWSLTEWLVVYIASKWISRVVGAKGWSNMKPCVWRDWWRRGWMDPQWRPVAVGGEQPRLSAAQRHQSLAPQLESTISPEQWEQRASWFGRLGPFWGEMDWAWEEAAGVRGCLGESPDTGWPDRWFFTSVQFFCNKNAHRYLCFFD